MNSTVRKMMTSDTVLVSREIGFKICRLITDSGRYYESEERIAMAARLELVAILKSLLSGELKFAEEQDCYFYNVDGIRAMIDRYTAQ